MRNAGIKSQSRAGVRAFTLPEAILVSCIFAVMIGVLVASLSRSRRHVHGANCVNNLRQISLSFKQWGLDNDDRYPMLVSVTNGGTKELIVQGNVFTTFLVMSNELNTPKVLICPGEKDEERPTATTWSDQSPAGQTPFRNNFNTSYFIGVDAEDARPQMLLVGDSHFALGGKRVPPGLLRLGTNSLVSWPRPIRERHEKGGNIGLTDGSVINCGTKSFREMLRQSGDPNNRLAIP